MNPITPPSLFLVEDNNFYRTFLEEALSAEPFLIESFTSGESFLENLYRMPTVVILDHRLKGIGGIDVLKQIKAFDPDIQVIVLSGQEDLEIAVNTLRYGAFDYLTKDENTLPRLRDALQKIQNFRTIALTQHRRTQYTQWALMGTLTILFTLIALIFFAPQLLMLG